MKFTVKRLSVLLLVGILFVIFCGLEDSADSPESTSIKLFEPGKVEKDVTYRSIGDVSLSMDIYQPLHEADSPVPALIYIHGGGWYSGDKDTGKGLYDIPYLVSRGFLVAAINYRLAPRYQFPTQIEDVRHAIRFIKTNAGIYGIDPERIGVWGDSAGGHLAALVGVAHDAGSCGCTGDYDECLDCVQAVADIYGPTDLTSIFEVDLSPLMEHVFGTADCYSQIIQSASPINYVSSDDPPFLIIHGDRDEVVPLEQSQMLYQRLVSAGVPAELVVVNNCGHRFIPVGGQISPTRSQLTAKIADFFERYLYSGRHNYA